MGPDAKSQLSVKYQDGIPTGVTSIVLSTQHLDEKMTSADVRSVVEPYIREVLPENWISNETKWHVNPTGKFVIGGPDGDAGLTGRKIIVDTYGGAAPHGGGEPYPSLGGVGGAAAPRWKLPSTLRIAFCFFGRPSHPQLRFS